MNILVIGGNGFLGSNLVSRLPVKDNRIVVFDKNKNIFFQEKKDISYVYGNFSDTSKVLSLAKEADIIFHFLGTTVPAIANLNPVFDIESNLINTVKFLKGLKASNCKRIIYISSGGTVYGNPKTLPINEEHHLNPIGSYGIVKTAIEHYVKFYSDINNLSYCILRPSNPYGPGQNYIGDQGVIANFLYKSILKKPILVWGDGRSIRDYIYIDDFIDLTIKAGLSNKSGIYNVGSGQGNSVLDIIKLIKKNVNLDLEVQYDCKAHKGVSKVVLDITKSKETFNWKPNIELDYGVIKLYKWIKNRI